MQARLLWKDMRQFGPAWVVLALAGLGGFGLALYYAETAEARSVALWIVALGCTCLYALAVGSAALAGEREGGTMGWLDTLPVPRRVLWGSKAVFGVASTLVLAVVLFGVAAMRLELGEVPGSENVGRLGVILGVVVVLLEGVGWGLVWSAMLSNVVAAAALAVLCFLSLTASPGLDPRGLAEEWPVRLMLAVVTGGVSLWVFTRVGPPRREWSLRGGRRRRAAVGVGDSTGAAEIIKPRGGTRPTRRLAWQAWRQVRAMGWPLIVIGLIFPNAWNLFQYWTNPFGNDGPALAVGANILVALIAGLTLFGADTRHGTQRFLAHQGARPRVVWLVRNLVWIGALLLLWTPYLFGLGRNWLEVNPVQSGQAMLFSIIASFVTVTFAVGQLSGMIFRRGITAGLVAFLSLTLLAGLLGMLLKLGMMSVAWPFVLALCVLGVACAWSGDWLIERPGAGRWVRLGLLLGGVGTALFAAYTSNRAFSIPKVDPLPAEVVARIEAEAGGIPAEENAADLYREARSKLKSIHPVPGAPTEPGEEAEREVQGAVAPELEDSGGMAAMMGGMMLGIEEPQPEGAGPVRPENLDELLIWVVREGWDPEAREVAVYLEENQEALALVRAAVERPHVQFTPLVQQTVGSRKSVYLYSLRQLLGASARQRQAAGDRLGAWDDIMAIARMGRQYANFASATLDDLSEGLSIDDFAMELQVAWALDPSITPRELRMARARLVELPPMPSPTGALAVEEWLRLRTLSLPKDELIDSFRGLANLSFPEIKVSPTLRTTWRESGAGRAVGSASTAVLPGLKTTPWEMARTRRAVRLLFAAERARVEGRGIWFSGSLMWPVEPWYEVEIFIEGEPVVFSSGEIRQIIETTPLASELLYRSHGFRLELDAEKLNAAKRGAVALVMALRSWQLAHEGNLPEKLEELIPSELEYLPVDPFSNPARQGFRYIPSHGQPIIPWLLGPYKEYIKMGWIPQPTEGHHLLYSIGPDRIDQNGRADLPRTRDPRTWDGGDLLIAIPDHIPVPSVAAEKAP